MVTKDGSQSDNLHALHNLSMWLIWIGNALAIFGFVIGFENLPGFNSGLGSPARIANFPMGLLGCTLFLGGMVLFGCTKIALEISFVEATKVARKWSMLAQVDPDIRDAVNQAQKLGPQFDALLLKNYMSIDDKFYLPAILNNIIDTASNDGTLKVRNTVEELEGTNLIEKVITVDGTMKAGLLKSNQVIGWDGQRFSIYDSLQTYRDSVNDWGTDYLYDESQETKAVFWENVKELKGGIKIG